MQLWIFISYECIVDVVKQCRETSLRASDSIREGKTKSSLGVVGTRDSYDMDMRFGLFIRGRLLGQRIR